MKFMFVFFSPLDFTVFVSLFCLIFLKIQFFFKIQKTVFLWYVFRLFLFFFQSLSGVQLFVTPMDRSPPDSSVHEILQARILEWIAISFSGGLLNPGIKPVSCLAGGFFTTETPRKQCLQVDHLISFSVKEQDY